jgi:hypothetical protein
MEDHIDSKNWSYMNHKLMNSEDYNSHIGVMRLMFNLTEDPKEIVTLISTDNTEVWGKYQDDWQRLFAC